MICFINNTKQVVIPAKAGIHRAAWYGVDQWTPAFAGVTYRGAA